MTTVPMRMRFPSLMDARDNASPKGTGRERVLQRRAPVADDSPMAQRPGGRHLPVTYAGRRDATAGRGLWIVPVAAGIVAVVLLALAAAGVLGSSPALVGASALLVAVALGFLLVDNTRLRNARGSVPTPTLSPACTTDADCSPTSMPSSARRRRAARGSSRWSTSTASRSTTTRSGTRPGTACSRTWLGSCAAPSSVPVQLAIDWAETSSACSGSSTEQPRTR